MSEARLRRWLVPGAALAAVIVPLLVGACFAPEELEWLRGCDDCEQCEDGPLVTPFGGGPTPEDPLPPLPQERLGQEPGSGYAQPPEETPPDETAQERGATGEEEAGTPPTPPFRPRIPDGVLQPRPEPRVSPPTY